jgi:hypothetical protein
VIERTLVELGVRERFRIIKPQEATVEQIAVHGDRK